MAILGDTAPLKCNGVVFSTGKSRVRTKFECTNDVGAPVSSNARTVFLLAHSMMISFLDPIRGLLTPLVTIGVIVMYSFFF